MFCERYQAPRENADAATGPRLPSRRRLASLYLGLSAVLAGVSGPASAAEPSQATCQQRINYLHATDRSIGREDAPVKFTMYGSLACPHCKLFATETWDILLGLVAKGYVRFDFRQFPIIGEGEVAQYAAVLALKARPKEFFEVAKLLLLNQDEWEEDASLNELRLFGDTLARYGLSASSIDDASLYNEVESDLMCYSKYMGVKATPTFVVNGVKYEGVITTKDLIAIIKKAVGDH